MQTERIGYMGRNEAGLLYGWISQETSEGPGRSRSVTEKSEPFETEQAALAWLQQQQPARIMQQDNDGRFVPYRAADTYFLGQFDAPHPDTPMAAQRQFWQELESRVAQAKRYTWAVTKHQYDTPDGGRTVYKAMMSAGHGQLATGVKYTSYEAPPSFAQLKQSMLEYEAYSAQKDQQQTAAQGRAVAAVAEKGLRPGQAFKEMRLDGGDVFSSVVIEQITESGRVKAAGKKRGSRNTYLLESNADHDFWPNLNREADFGLFAEPPAAAAGALPDLQATANAAVAQYQTIARALLRRHCGLDLNDTRLCESDTVTRLLMDGVPPYQAINAEAEDRDLHRIDVAGHYGVPVWRPLTPADEATAQLPSSSNTLPANTQKGRYTGPIAKIIDQHLLQDIGQGQAVWHAKADLSAVPKLGQTVTIQYQAGRAQVQAKSPPRSRER